MRRRLVPFIAAALTAVSLLSGCGSGALPGGPAPQETTPSAHAAR